MMFVVAAAVMLLEEKAAHLWTRQRMSMKNQISGQAVNMMLALRHGGGI